MDIQIPLVPSSNSFVGQADASVDVTLIAPCFFWRRLYSFFIPRNEISLYLFFDRDRHVTTRYNKISGVGRLSNTLRGVLLLGRLTWQLFANMSASAYWSHTGWFTFTYPRNMEAKFCSNVPLDHYSVGGNFLRTFLLLVSVDIQPEKTWPKNSFHYLSRQFSVGHTWIPYSCKKKQPPRKRRWKPKNLLVLVLNAVSCDQ